MMRESISLVMPFYNEALNAEAVVNDAARVLESLSADYEIIAVNDGSTDDTRSILETLAEKNRRVRPLHHETNLGYGAALRTGIAAAAGEWLFLCDGDGQFCLDELALFASELREYPVVLGFRIRRQDNLLRRFNSFLYNRAARTLLGVRVRDINCAMKAFRRTVFAGVRFRTAGIIISLDILLRLLAGGFRFKELGVSHRPRPAGTQTGGRPAVILKAVKEFLKLLAEELPLRMRGGRGPRKSC